MYCFAPPQVPKTLLYKEERNCGNLFESPFYVSCSCRRRSAFLKDHAAHWLAHPRDSDAHVHADSNSDCGARVKSQESGLRTAVRASNHRPPSAVRRSSRRVYIGIGIGISCSLARKFTIAMKHLSLSLSASLLGRCPGLLVCSGQAQAYSQVLPTVSESYIA